MRCHARDRKANQVQYTFEHQPEIHFTIELLSIRTLSWRRVTWSIVVGYYRKNYYHLECFAFNKEELSWICSTYSRCECRIRPAPPLPSTFLVPIEKVSKSRKATSFLFMEWTNLVMEFTHRDLTHKIDRLPAISGIAARMEKQTRTDCFYSMWFYDLACHLLWYRDRKAEIEPPARLKARYAPSWSWASISGPTIAADQ